MTGNGDIIILGGVYEMKAGKVTFLLIEPMARLSKQLYSIFNWGRRASQGLICSSCPAKRNSVDSSPNLPRN
jgi:hypothetical protein